MALAKFAKYVPRDFSVSADLWMNEDCRGQINDPVERKKRQNRLRQRAWRERKRTALKLIHRSTNSDINASWKGYGMLVISNNLSNDVNTSTSISTSTTLPTNCPRGDLAPSQHHHDKIHVPLIDKPTTIADKHKIIPPLLPYNTLTTNRYIPKPYPIVFPLTSDHRLLTLVQYNVIRAVIYNMTLISAQDSLPKGCQESLGVTPRDATDSISPHAIPPDLQPTPLQKQIRKIENAPYYSSLPYWVHALPFPQLRDNLILYSGSETCDFQDLAYDLGEGLYRGFDDAERRGFLIWGDSWNAQGWEVSDGFIRKWGFLLRGCSDIMEATNWWRGVRDDEKLIPDM